jgi:hypothetical protein
MEDLQKIFSGWSEDHTEKNIKFRPIKVECVSKPSKRGTGKPQPVILSAVEREKWTKFEKWNVCWA